MVAWIVGGAAAVLLISLGTAALYHYTHPMTDDERRELEREEQIW